MQLIMSLNNDEANAICETERSMQLQQHTKADGMGEDVIGGPFLFELDGGDRVVFESACTHNGGAILTHVEALKILAGDDYDNSPAGELMRRLGLTTGQWDSLSTDTKATLVAIFPYVRNKQGR